MGPRSRRARAATLVMAAALLAFTFAPAAWAAPPDHAPTQADPAGPVKAMPDKAMSDKAMPDRAMPDTAGPDKARPDKAEPPTAPDPELQHPETPDVDYYASTPPGLLDDGDSDDQGRSDDDDDDGGEAGEEPEPVDVEGEDVEDEAVAADEDEEEDRRASDEADAAVVSTSQPTPTTTVPGILPPVDSAAGGPSSNGSTTDPTPPLDETSDLGLAVAIQPQINSFEPAAGSLSRTEALDPAGSTTSSVADWTMFFDTQLEPVARPIPDGRRDATSVVLSWLVEREAVGSSMTAMSPIVVLTTIWDAISSAGSGLAAPASGLLTFTAMVLLDRRRLRGAAARPTLEASTLRAG